MTATEIAALEVDALLSNKRDMDDFIHLLAHLKLDNASGEAYRSICLAAFKDGVLLKSDHHTSSSCAVKITSKPGLKIARGSQNSRFGRDPHPAVIDGEWICVWSDGKWVKKGPWVTHVRDVVSYFINRAAEKKRQIEAEDVLKKQKIADAIKEKELAVLTAWSAKS